MSPARPESSGAPSGSRFPSRVRITRTEEIRRLFRRGKREGTSHLDVFHTASPVSHSRLGLVVGKHGHTIVERNRVKRRLREIGRKELLPRLRGREEPLDVLVRARPEAYDATYDELRNELIELTEKRWSRPSSSD